MDGIHILVKPVSASCNMRCSYCFYLDEADKRAIPCYGTMTPETVGNLVQKALTSAEACTFSFQGGEPTLAGLDFYRSFIDTVRQHTSSSTTVHYAIQTNGFAINEDWAAFFAENDFLVGLSLDGTKDVHNALRKDCEGKGTFSRAIHAAGLFDRYKVPYNVLTVITAPLAENISEVYAFYKQKSFLHQQYIPCLDPLGEERGKYPWSLTPILYGDFLCRLFDLWFKDLMGGTLVSIRYFENLLLLLKGRAPESCGMLGRCVPQTVVEADGSVYPCDFYALDEFCLGNLNKDSFAELETARRQSGFAALSTKRAPDCSHCVWRQLCRGGCRRDCEPVSGKSLPLNYFCSSYKQFLGYAYDRLLFLASRIP